MRNEPSRRKSSETALSPERVREWLSEHDVRLERLEKAAFPGGQADLTPSPPKPRKGRKPKLETDALLERRKNLTAWLEQNWPRLLVAMREAESSGNYAGAIVALVAAKNHGIPGVGQPPFYDSPERFATALEAFFKSGRYHGNPRNLAAAMAGLPELSWKRSFDICTEHPHKTGHALEALWDYMSRNFPDRLRELEGAVTELDVKIVLARSRTNDPVYRHFKENPGTVKERIEVGKPMDPNSRGPGTSRFEETVPVIPAQPMLESYECGTSVDSASSGVE